MGRYFTGDVALKILLCALLSVDGKEIFLTDLCDVLHFIFRYIILLYI